MILGHVTSPFCPVFDHSGGVKFDMGNYFDATVFSEKALKLCETHSDEILEQKICVRLAKVYLRCGRYTECRSLVSKVTSNEEWSSLSQFLSPIEASGGLFPEDNRIRDQVFDRLPRYKPSL